MSKKVVVAMSGGVDSSVVAALLKRQNYEVVGVFCKFWSPYVKASGDKVAENLCCNQDSLLRARSIAQKLKIPFYVLDLSKEFKKEVVDYFIAEYKAGRTPNPCVVCNQKIKFGLLLDKAKKLGADYLATGHYVRLRRKSEIRNPKSETNPKSQITNFRLLTAKDKIKDQTYFLWTLTQKQLSKILFPIGDYTKAQVRQMAKKWNLPSAEIRDSQAICFIPDRNVVSFLKKYIKNNIKSSDIIDIKGNKLGEHEGLPFYTIGQRTRLGVNPNIPDFPPQYVVSKDAKNNRLIIGAEKDLYQKELIAENTHWIKIDTSFQRPETGKISAKIRYGQKPQPCHLEKISEKQIKVIFKEPQRAITPGQSIVFYRGRELLGGAIIKSVL